MKRTQLCHPLMFHLLKLSAAGSDPRLWIDSVGDAPVVIDGAGPFSRDEILYYYQKYLIFKENGLFSTVDQKQILCGAVEPESIKKNLANCKQVVFEVTENCNLQCHYCGYGQFYADYENRENKNLDIRSALKLLDYLQELWNSPLNNSRDRMIFISFYGGEPLMNFPFIETIVRHVRAMHAPLNRFGFSMTTNALLLKKHMGFLVENQFKLLISLDGDGENSAYRVFKNGAPAFETILENVQALRSEYPDYFRRHVNFNAVLHNKNSVADIYHYFKEHFGKSPTISELNTTGIKESQKDEFRATYANIRESLHQSEDYRPIERDMFVKLPDAASAMHFIHFNSDFCFTDYNSLLYFDSQVSHCPTGTCSPFSRKLFVTSEGRILPCERINHKHALGTVTPEGVALDFRRIAATYNDYFDKIRRQCHGCYNAQSCKQCIFNLDSLTHEKLVCYGFTTEEQNSRNISAIISYLEEQPEMYDKLLREVIIE